MRQYTPSFLYSFFQTKTMSVAFAVLFLIFGLLFNIAFAQTPTSQDLNAEQVLRDSTGIEEMVMVANVNVVNANVISQNNNSFRISFVLSNDELVQPNIKYSVRLLDMKKDGSFSVVDENVYDEKISMGENTKISREIIYDAPAYLNGTYNLELYFENGTGLILTFYGIGEVTLSGDEKFIKLSDCYLKVAGDKSNKNYRLYEGVDIMPDETLVGYCTATNGFSKSITASPIFTTYLRSRFGEVLRKGVLGDKPITITASKNYQISFTIPTADKPQAYDAKMTLVDENGVTISNSVIFHYVLKGESATIQNVRLDKSSYKKGDSINISLFWTGSVDNFLNSRYSASQDQNTLLEMTIVDSSDGNICSNQIVKDIQPKDSSLDISTTATKDCIYPSVLVKISSPDGTVLSQRDFDFKEAAIAERASSSEKGGVGVFDIVAIIVIVILLIGALIIFRKFKGPTGGALAVVALIFIGGAFVAPQSASAALACWGGGFICATANVSQTEYEPSESIGNIPVLIYGARCGNYYYQVKGYERITGGWNYMGSVSNVYKGNSKYLYTGNLYAPSSPGGYYIRFKFDAWQNCFNQQSDDNCTVNDPIPQFGFSIRIDVSDPTPSVSFSAPPPPLNYNTPTTITWNSNLVDSCVASGGWSGPRSPSGSESTGNLTSTTSYTLQCNTIGGGGGGSGGGGGGGSGGGGTTSNSITVIVNPPKQCSDGMDNDNDGWIDFPQDLGCISASDNDESNIPNNPPQCSDGIDNDADAAIDGNDNGCSSPSDNSELPDPDFSLQKSSDINVTIIGENVQATGQTNITVNANETFTNNVTFSTANLQIGAGLPTDLSKYSFTDSTLDNSEYTTGTPFTVTIPNTITSGTYKITVNGVGNGLNRDIDVFITVTNVNPFFKEI